MTYNVFGGTLNIAQLNYYWLFGLAFVSLTFNSTPVVFKTTE